MTDRTIGVIAREQTNPGPFGMQTYYFEEMSAAARNLGADILFLSFEDAVSGNGMAWKYSTQWERIKHPTPGVLYDRVICRTLDQREKLKALLYSLQQQGYVIFNSPKPQSLIDDKLAFSRFCKTHQIDSLHCFPVEEIDWEFLIAGGAYYLKPRYGFGGKGITILRAESSNLALISCDTGTKRILPRTMQAKAVLLQEYPSSLYVASPAAASCRLAESCFDLRVIIQKRSPCEAPAIAAMVVRVGKAGSRVSNIASAGSAMPVEAALKQLSTTYRDFQSGVILPKIEELCLKSATALDQYDSAADIGFDILIKSDFSPAIIEANAKPARWAFSLISQNRSYCPEVRERYSKQRDYTVFGPVEYALSTCRPNCSDIFGVSYGSEEGSGGT